MECSSGARQAAAEAPAACRVLFPGCRLYTSVMASPRKLPTLRRPASRQEFGGNVSRDATPVNDWAFAIHSVGVDRELQRARWPEYTPECAAPVGRNWRGTALGEFRAPTSWNASPIRSFTSSSDTFARTGSHPLPRLNHLMNETFRHFDMIQGTDTLPRGERVTMGSTMRPTASASTYGRAGWKWN